MHLRAANKSHDPGTACSGLRSSGLIATPAELLSPGKTEQGTPPIRSSIVSSEPRHEVTQMLAKWSGGDPKARKARMPRVHAEIRRLADLGAQQARVLELRILDGRPGHVDLPGRA